MIDTQRLSQSDSMSTSISDPYIPNTEIACSGDVLNATITADSLDTVGVMILNGADGEPITSYPTIFVSSPNNGCPLCGVVNLP